MIRTKILVGVLSICLNAFGASAGLSSNEQAVTEKMSQLSTIDLSNPYSNLPENDVMFPCLEILAKELNVSSEDLFALINFETGGKLDPKIASKTSSAKGLLQFTDRTSIVTGKQIGRAHV